MEDTPPTDYTFSSSPGVTPGAIADGLVGYWPMDGNANDAKGSNDGTNSGGTFGTTDQKYGTGMVTFSGSTSQQISLSSTPSFSGGVMTWSVWVKGTGKFHCSAGSFSTPRRRRSTEFIMARVVMRTMSVAGRRTRAFST